jgi:hypothetical protein
MTPEINAVSTILFCASVGLILVWYRLRMRGAGEMEAPRSVFFRVRIRSGKETLRPKGDKKARYFPSSL